MKNLQFTGVLYEKPITLKQISKTTAKRLFCSGHRVYMQSSNFHPLGVWSRAFDIVAYEIDENGVQQFDPLPGESFDSHVNSFAYYNCGSEQGRYIHFYKSV